MTTLDGESALARLEDAERAVLDALAAADRIGREVRDALIGEAIAHEADARRWPSLASSALALARDLKADARTIHHRRRGILTIRYPLGSMVP